MTEVEDEDFFDEEPEAIDAIDADETHDGEDFEEDLPDYDSRQFEGDDFEGDVDA